jgi:hypothetical protein
MGLFEELIADPTIRLLFRKIRLTLQFKHPAGISKFSLFVRTSHISTIEGFILRKIRLDRSPQLSVYADKFAMRHFVKSNIGEEYLTEIYATYERAEQIEWDKLPEECVLKCSHSSGGMVILSKNVGEEMQSIELDYKNWGKYLIHPFSLDRFRIENFFSKMLKQNYSNYTDYFEYAYSQIDPVVIAEELLTDEHGNLPSDFKIWCFFGKAQLIQIDTNRYSNHTRDFYNPNWQKLQVKATYPNSMEVLNRPGNLNEMIQVAEKLSQNSDLLRVDLYDLGDRIVVGELTNYPGGGVEKFAPRSFSMDLYVRLQALDYK